MFSQLLQLFPRTEFETAVRRTGAEYGAKGFSSWSQLVSMLFCQLGRAHSLREIEGGLKSCEGKLAHLGIEPPARSTLAYANAHRPWQLFEAVFHDLYAKVAGSVRGPKRKFRFKNKLVSIDSTVIDLSLSMYDWAKYQRTKGAVKLHLVLDHDGYLPSFGVVTDGTVADVRVAQSLHFDSGTIVVDDRGYNDYALFSRWCGQGVFFVTRMKSDARYEVLEQRPIFKPEGNVVADQRIRLSSEQARRDCPHELRRIEFIHPQTGQILVFLTNLHKLSAATIAAIYRDRWQVELFFKALKQNLKIKAFLGTSKNAVMTQIWIALCVHLLLAYLKYMARLGASLQQIIRLLQLNLFARRDLMALLRGDPPPPNIDHPQTSLAFA